MLEKIWGWFMWFYGILAMGAGIVFILMQAAKHGTA